MQFVWCDIDALTRLSLSQDQGTGTSISIPLGPRPTRCWHLTNYCNHSPKPKPTHPVTSSYGARIMIRAAWQITSNS